MPSFINKIGNNGETHVKLQTQVMACLTSFVRGLIDEESAEDSEANLANRKLLEPYANDLATGVSSYL